MTVNDPNLNYETPPPVGNATNGPGIGLIVSALLGILLRIIMVLVTALGMTGSIMTNDRDMGVNMFSGGIGIAISLFTMIVSLFIAFGGFKMRQNQSYGLALTAAILALVPCSSCCCITLPFGVWALVVLMKPEVKAAFR